MNQKPCDNADAPRRQPAEDLTRLLRAAGEGSTDAQTELLRCMYGELRSMAQARMRGERDGHTLSATALVHEAYLRLFMPGLPESVWGAGDRVAFYRAASAAMRRILIDHARARTAQKRGGVERQQRIGLDLVAAAENSDPDELLALDQALSRLEEVDPRAAEVVRLRFFAGQDFECTAELLNISVRTAKRDWEFARAWLQQGIECGRDSGRDEES